MMNTDFHFKPEDKILVVAPHPDDESIGCGGLLALYGRQCDVLLMTDGRHGHGSGFTGSEEELAVRREEELKKAMELAHVHEIRMLRIPDGELYGSYSAVKEVDIRPYDYIFVTNRRELHEDHRVSYQLMKKLIRAQHGKAVLAEYEVWTPMTRPTRYLDITAVIETKRKMIEQHASQIHDIDYAAKGIGLSCYRGIYRNVAYAEAYTVEKDIGLMQKLSSRIPKAWKRKIRNIRKKS